MALDHESKMKLLKLQDAALEILSDITELFPDDYRFTLIARHERNEDDRDIVLTDDVMDDAIGALQHNKEKMEKAE